MQNTSINISQRVVQCFAKCSHTESGQVALNEFGEYFKKHQVCLDSLRKISNKNIYRKAIILTYVLNVDICHQPNEFQGQCFKFRQYFLFINSLDFSMPLYRSQNHFVKFRRYQYVISNMVNYMVMEENWQNKITHEYLIV